jgi:2,5-diketo-D-gluconate reductase B
VPLAESLRAMAELRSEGKTRHIGVSNFPVRLLREATEQHDADLFCDQVEYHPYLSQRPVLEYLRAHGMMLTAYSPIARGKVLDDPTLIEIGRRHGKTPVQVALRWLMEQDAVAAIPKASSEKHCLANLEIFDFSLSREDMDAIGRRTGNERLIDPSWAPQWDAA